MKRLMCRLAFLIDWTDGLIVLNLSFLVWKILMEVMQLNTSKRFKKLSFLLMAFVSHKIASLLLLLIPFHVFVSYNCSLFLSVFSLISDDLPFLSPIMSDILLMFSVAYFFLGSCYCVQPDIQIGQITWFWDDYEIWPV
jgi:hypothetical protein